MESAALTTPAVTKDLFADQFPVPSSTYALIYNWYIIIILCSGGHFGCSGTFVVCISAVYVTLYNLLWYGYIYIRCIGETISAACTDTLHGPVAY